MRKNRKAIFSVIPIILLTVVIGFMVNYNAPVPLPEDFTVTAHSGCEGTPDNSMEFVRKGLEINAQVLEVDVTFRADGTPVLIHKEQADADEGLLFDEVIKYISENSDTVRLNLDLKSTANLSGIVEILDRYGMRERCFYTGVNADFVEAVRADGELPYYLNTPITRWKKHSPKELNAALERVKKSGAIGINCSLKYASKEMVELFRENGLLVSYWTANSKKEMIKLLNIAPDNITTRRPVFLNEIKNSVR
jgi:glycerophosphoryl diester phosphodiesterase